MGGKFILLICRETIIASKIAGSSYDTNSASGISPAPDLL
jgi:hypothetical protein